MVECKCAKTYFHISMAVILTEFCCIWNTVDCFLSRSLNRNVNIRVAKTLMSLSAVYSMRKEMFRQGVIATFYQYIFTKVNKNKLSFYYIQIPSYFIYNVLSERGWSCFSNSFPIFRCVIFNHQEVALSIFCNLFTEIYWIM